jgi:serine/threonine protein kinase
MVHGGKALQLRSSCPLLRAGGMFSLGAAVRGHACPALDISGTLKALCQMVRGLSHMHARGFVHVAFKPGNVMLAADGKVETCGPTPRSVKMSPVHGVQLCRDDLTAVIEDFGMASPVGSERYVPGRTAYNPPEVCFAYIEQLSHCITCYCTGCAPSHLLSACVPSSYGPCIHHRLR